MAKTAVVCVVCSFTAGLLLGVLLTQCHGHCHRKGKRGQTEIPPVYEDIPLEKTPAIELKTNEAYGPIQIIIMIFFHTNFLYQFCYNFLQKHLHSYHFPRVNMHTSSVNTSAGAKHILWRSRGQKRADKLPYIHSLNMWQLVSHEMKRTLNKKLILGEEM